MDPLFPLKVSPGGLEIPLRIHYSTSSIWFVEGFKDLSPAALEGLSKPLLAGSLSGTFEQFWGRGFSVLGEERFPHRESAGFVGSLEPLRGPIPPLEEGGCLQEVTWARGSGSPTKAVRAVFQDPSGAPSRVKGPATSTWALAEDGVTKTLKEESWALGGRGHREDGPALVFRGKDRGRTRCTWILEDVEIFSNSSTAGVLLEGALPWELLNRYVLEVLGKPYGLWKKEQEASLVFSNYPEELILREHLLHFATYREMPVAWWGPLLLERALETLEGLSSWQEEAEDGSFFDLPGRAPHG